AGRSKGYTKTPASRKVTKARRVPRPQNHLKRNSIEKQSRKTSWQAALAGMVTGTVVLALWKQIGLSSRLYEIVPGFIANCLTILLVNMIVPQKDQRVLNQYHQVVARMKTRK
ncbi:MAG: hypothetical protein ACYSYT_07690, partial [Planctomycetota bacterium]